MPWKRATSQAGSRMGAGRECLLTSSSHPTPSLKSSYFPRPRGRGCATEQKKKEKKEKKHKKDKTKVKKKDKKKKKKERACSDELSVSSSELREMFEGGSDFDMDELLS